MFLTVSLALTVSLLLVSLPELLLFLGWGLAEQLAVFLAASLLCWLYSDHFSVWLSGRIHRLMLSLTVLVWS